MLNCNCRGRFCKIRLGISSKWNTAYLLRPYVVIETSFSSLTNVRTRPAVENDLIVLWITICGSLRPCSASLRRSCPNDRQTGRIYSYAIILYFYVAFGLISFLFSFWWLTCRSFWFFSIRIFLFSAWKMTFFSFSYRQNFHRFVIVFISLSFIVVIMLLTSSLPITQ